KGGAVAPGLVGQPGDGIETGHIESEPGDGDGDATGATGDLENGAADPPGERGVEGDPVVVLAVVVVPGIGVGGEVVVGHACSPCACCRRSRRPFVRFRGHGASFPDHPWVVGASRVAANASGSSRLSISVFTLTGTKHTRVLAGGSIVSLTPPLPEPLTAQVPPQPCTPMPNRNGIVAGCWTERIALRGMRARNAQPMRTSTWVSVTSTPLRPGPMPVIVASQRKASL